MDLLEPLDVAMMTAELLSDPMHVAALLILAPPADAGPGYVDEIYTDALTTTAELDPRFRRHPHIGVDTAGLWVWRSDDAIEMHRYLQRRTLATDDTLSTMISELHSERLDQSRPMWIAYLIDGLDDNRFALYIKVHHTVVDGVAGLRMITDAMTTDPDRRSMPPLYTAAPNHPAERTTRRRILYPFSLVGFVRNLALGELASLKTRHTLLPFGAPYTRFNGRLGREHAFAGASWPKSRIRAVQEAAGVTGNDVATAVVAGTVRQWLAAHDELPHKSLVAICPVTVRSREHAGDEDQHGNLFGLELCPLHTDSADPAERLAHIHQAMTWAKRQVAKRGSNATTLSLAPSIGSTVLLPMVPFAPRLRRGYNLTISNVPGPQTDLYWNGAHLEELYPSTAIGGQALNVTMCSYADRVTFGYVSGRAVRPDIESLIPLTELALAELETAVGAVA